MTIDKIAAPSRRRFIAAAGAASLALAAPAIVARAGAQDRSRCRSAGSRGPPATRRSRST